MTTWAGSTEFLTGFAQLPYGGARVVDLYFMNCVFTFVKCHHIYYKCVWVYRCILYVSIYGQQKFSWSSCSIVSQIHKSIYTFIYTCTLKQLHCETLTTSFSFPGTEPPPVCELSVKNQHWSSLLLWHFPEYTEAKLLSNPLMN